MSWYCLQWDQGKIIRFGWTGDEKLAVLNEEGTYRLYDLQGDYQQYSLGADAAEVGIIDARIHETGLVALTGSLTLLEVKGWEGGKPLTLANPGKYIHLLSTYRFVTSCRHKSTTPCLGRYTPRPDYISPCRSLVISRRDSIQCRQPGNYRSKAFSWSFLPPRTISKWQIPCATHGFWCALGSFHRLPA